MHTASCILTPKWLQCVLRLLHLILIDRPPLLLAVATGLLKDGSRLCGWGVRRTRLGASGDKDGGVDVPVEVLLLALL